MPNVNLVNETVDAMSATRSYEANIAVFSAMKTMAQRGIESKRYKSGQGWVLPYWPSHGYTTNIHKQGLYSRPPEFTMRHKAKV